MFYLSVSAYIAYTLTIPGKSPVTFDPLKIGERVANVSFQSTDGLLLSGWYFPGTNDKAIMFVHGAGNQNRVNEVYGTSEIAKYFLEQGYTILMFDLRGTGNSQFSRISFGQNESKDVAGAYQYLISQDYKPQSIGIISNSLGAISTIMAADSIKDAGGIVLDSPATEVKTIVSNIMVNEHSVPRFLHPGIYEFAKILYNIDINSVRPVDHISILRDTPLLFLVGDKDALIPPSDTNTLAAKVNRGQVEEFKNAGHIGSYKTEPERYKQVVLEFFSNNLK